MVSSFRHSRNGRSKKSTSHKGSCDGASQGTSDDHPSQRNKDTEPVRLQAAKQRGRKQGSLTKLRMPLRGRKVLLEPLGDMQFEYLNRRGATYKYTSQLGVIIKREYPGLVQDKDEHGAVLRTRAALEWSDYFLSKKDNLGRTAGDRRLFEVNKGKEEEAECVLETYLHKRVKDMMYQARVDAVKVYYMKKLGQKLVDKLARSIELTYEEYLEGKLKWCSVDVWPELCHHWCSEDFLETRKR
ncbi:unnamed protein product, partial [Urochloa humidicola]